MILTRDARLALIDRFLPRLTDTISKNAADFLLDRWVTVQNYKEIPIHKSIWQSGEQDNRNWNFTLHSFAPLDALMAKSAWGTVELLVREWIETFGEIDPDTLGQFPWHDHATALRLDRLSLMALHDDGPKFSELARKHALLLLREDFYSKNTNHGFDQSLALLMASRVFAENCDTFEWEGVALERLVNELKFAFNEEGVHVENSPAYHVGMTANLVRARFVKQTLGIETDFDFDNLLNKALLFTSWTIGPDRKLALLGDSTERGGTPPPELEKLSNFKHLAYATSGGVDGLPLDTQTAIFPHAGYAFYRSSWFPWSDHVHIVMKSGFLSRYHRQDDDLNILLQGHGERWLIDSGLYNHNQADPVRIYMRSALAHNVPFIKGIEPQRRLPTRDKAPSLQSEVIEDSKYEAIFRGTTHMYPNVRLSRTLMIENSNRFHLVDQIKHRGKKPALYIQFHVPGDKAISATTQVAQIKGRRKELSIRLASGECEDCKVYSGMEGHFKSVYSPDYNISEPSQVIVFGPIKSERVRFRLEFI